MDLELAQTADVVAELFKRYEHAVFIGTKMEGDSVVEQWRYKGNGRLCTELAKVASWKIQQQYEANQKEEPDGGI